MSFIFPFLIVTKCLPLLLGRGKGVCQNQSQPIFLNLPVKRSQADTQQARSLCFVSFRIFKNLLNMHFLNATQVESGISICFYSIRPLYIQRQ